MSQDNTLRKSKRQPVPNPIYLQGISDLKKESNARNKKNTKIGDDEFVSYSQQDHQILGNFPASFIQSHQPFLPCIFPDGYHRRIQFVVQAKEEKTYKKQFKPVVKSTKKPQPSQSLLSIFQQAIEHAEIVDNISQEEDSKRENYIIEEPKILTAPVKTRKVRSQLEGHIQKLKIEDGSIQISHSTIGKIYFSINWKQPYEMVPQLTPQQLDLKKRIQNLKEIKKIAIFLK